jgi:uncharacterized protein
VSWKRIFWNPAEERLRCGWRLGIQAILMLAMGFSASWLVGLLAGATGDLAGRDLTAKALLRLSHENFAYAGLTFLAKGLAVVGSIWLAVRFVDKRSFSELGFRFHRAWWMDFAFGILLGAFLMAAVFLVEWWAGWITVVETMHTGVDGWGFWPAVVFMLVVFVFVGFYEELFSRGYQIRNLSEGLNFPLLGERSAIVLAWIAASVVFAFGHSMNPHASLVSCMGIIAAGILLGLPYVLTGELAVSIGLHISWNFFQGIVFGFPVSGRDFRVSFLGIQQAGPDSWTGGAFGPEAGILGFAACGIGCLLILLWMRWARSRRGVCRTIARRGINSA